MPFVKVVTREELSDAVRAKLAETLLVTTVKLHGRSTLAFRSKRLRCADYRTHIHR
jgi:hypothetical protein